MYQAFLDAASKPALPVKQDIKLYSFGGEIEDDGFITVYVSPPLRDRPDAAI